MSQGLFDGFIEDVGLDKKELAEKAKLTEGAWLIRYFPLLSLYSL